jgi:hypothetical protein
MTDREVYEGILIELNKLGAPELFIDEFNYYINKGIYQYSNKRYNIYDLNQQTSDDLQTLKDYKEISGTNIKWSGSEIPGFGEETLKEAKYQVKLPEQYFHLLNCILYYKVNEDYKCYRKGTILPVATKRITSDTMASVLHNAWLKPQYKLPYHMVLSGSNKVIGSWSESENYQNSKVEEKIASKSGKQSAHANFEDVNKDGKLNGTDYFVGPTLSIDYGSDISIFELTKVGISFLKVPREVNITPEQTMMTKDTTALMEFPDYVNREIIKETVGLIMLRNADPSLQMHQALNKAIPDAPLTGQPQQSSK